MNNIYKITIYIIVIITTQQRNFAAEQKPAQKTMFTYQSFSTSESTTKINILHLVEKVA